MYVSKWCKPSRSLDVEINNNNLTKSTTCRPESPWSQDVLFFLLSFTNAKLKTIQPLRDWETEKRKPLEPMCSVEFLRIISVQKQFSKWSGFRPKIRTFRGVKFVIKSAKAELMLILFLYIPKDLSWMFVLTENIWKFIAAKSFVSSCPPSLLVTKERLFTSRMMLCAQVSADQRCIPQNDAPTPSKIFKMAFSFPEPSFLLVTWSAKRRALVAATTGCREISDIR